MVMTTAGRNQLRDSITSDMDNGQAGSGTFPFNVDQTGLQTAQSDTNNILSSKFKSSNTITVTHVVTTSEANGKNLSEWEVRGNTDTDSFNRVVRAPLAKTSTDQFTMIHTFTINLV